MDKKLVRGPIKVKDRSETRPDAELVAETDRLEQDHKRYNRRSIIKDPLNLGIQSNPLGANVPSEAGDVARTLRNINARNEKSHIVIPQEVEQARPGGKSFLTTDKDVAQNLARNIRRMARDVLRNGLPVDVSKQTEVTEALGPGLVTQLLIARSKGIRNFK